MSQHKRILSVQDISCLGQCSNTVMLPILSAAGLETVVLPTALLSTHTGGFSGFTFLDMTEEMEKILAHWESLDTQFDLLCTGYFGSAAQIELLLQYAPRVCKPDALRIIDPVMGDNGKLYSIYDDKYVETMRKLCNGADVITPNLTEACLLAGVPYEDAPYSRERMEQLLGKLHALGAKRIVITGIMFDESTIGVVFENAAGEICTATGPYLNAHLHGTGDVYTAALIGYLSHGCKLEEAAPAALQFVDEAIEHTKGELEQHWYGLIFEPCLYRLTK